MRAPLRLLFVLLLLAFVVAPPVTTPAAAAACNATTSCPGGGPPPSGWSSWTDCDSSFCGNDSYCDAKGTDATLQPRERYRVYQYAGGSTCTEYQVAVFRAHCGCI